MFNFFSFLRLFFFLQEIRKDVSPPKKKKNVYTRPRLIQGSCWKIPRVTKSGPRLYLISIFFFLKKFQRRKKKNGPRRKKENRQGPSEVTIFFTCRREKWFHSKRSARGGSKQSQQLQQTRTHTRPFTSLSFFSFLTGIITRRKEVISSRWCNLRYSLQFPSSLVNSQNETIIKEGRAFKKKPCNCCWKKEKKRSPPSFLFPNLKADRFYLRPPAHTHTQNATTRGREVGRSIKRRFAWETLCWQQCKANCLP